MHTNSYRDIKPWKFDHCTDWTHYTITLAVWYKTVWTQFQDIGGSLAEFQLSMMTSSMKTFSALLAHCEGNHRSPVESLPLIKADDTKLWSFLWSVSEQTVEVTIEAPGDLRRHRARYDVTAMQFMTIGFSIKIEAICSKESTQSPCLMICISCSAGTLRLMICISCSAGTLSPLRYKRKYNYHLKYFQENRTFALGKLSIRTNLFVFSTRILI